jgi:AraC family transcriptional regulator, regulatory protein of adaptative response / DNA-3-methyladenine glycosylase II
VSDFRQNGTGEGGTIGGVVERLDWEQCYRAVTARDARFDGWFISAVRTTGIYCRPSCPAVTPKRRNLEFFRTAAAAQASGFRACRRCLPDAVPGSPDWNLRADLAARAMRLIGDGIVEREGVPGLASRLGYSERHLNRVLTDELGAGPLALARAHRAHAARLLLESTTLPMGDVAFAAGFASIRQFNDTLRTVFAVTPSELRASAARRARQPQRARQTSRVGGSGTVGGSGSPGSVRNPGSVDSSGGPGGVGGPAPATIALRLPFRSPMDAAGLHSFLAARAITGVEDATQDGYARTLSLPYGPATVRLTFEATRVEAALRLTDLRDLGAAVSRVRRLIDADADPIGCDEVLSADPALAPSVTKTPGIRLPGAVDGAEMVLRALLGQQVTVAAARRAASRLTAELGVRLDNPDGELTTLFPEPAAIAEHAASILTGPRRRIEAIVRVCEALASGELAVHTGRDLDELRAGLEALPGIGSWTSGYVAMRVLGAPDVLLTNDIAVRRGAEALGIPSDPDGLEAHGKQWSPWRSYAGLHLWRAAGSSPTNRRSA